MIQWPPLSKLLVTMVRGKNTLFYQEEACRRTRLGEGGHLLLLFGVRGRRKEEPRERTKSL